MANLSNINGKFVVEQTTGYVGIGTTNPNFLIEAAGTNAELALNAASIYRVRSTSNDEFIITKNGVGDRLTIAPGGAITMPGTVTIGNSAYGSSLGQLRIINDAASSPASLSLFGYNNVADNTDFAIIEFAMQSSGTGGNVLASIKGQSDGTSENAADLRFGTANVTTGLTEKMRITSGGNVGIGYDNPQARLDIQDNTGTPFMTRNSSGLAMFNEISSGYSYLYLYQIGGGAKVVLSTNGNSYFTGGYLGIGVTSPASFLHVSGDTGGADSIVRFQNTNSTAKSTRIQLLDSAGTVGDALIAYDHSNASPALHYLGMGVNNSTTLVINNSDQVGIGTTTPNEKLVIGTTGGTQNIEISNSYIQSFNRSGSPGYASLGFYASSYTFNVSDVLIGTNGKFLQGKRNTGSAVIDMIGFGAGTDTLQIKGGTSGAANAISFYDTGGFLGTWYNGNFGIGTSTPGNILHVSSAGSDTYVRIGNNAGYDAGIYFNTSTDWTIGTDTSNSNAFTIGNGSSVGASAKLTITTGGTLTVSGDVVAYGSPSDKTFKENIKPVTNALDKVSRLQGVTFDWKESESILDIKEDIGFIAQDVQKVLPELVRENEDGKLSLRDKGIVPILVEAIKELKAEIEELKKHSCDCKK